jgi:murein L,D-transpeptidase YafK
MSLWKKIALWSLLTNLMTLTIYYVYPEKKLPKGTKINLLVVYKSKRELLAYSNGKLIKTYKISLGRNPIGHKLIEGDKKTPEGVYSIFAKNSSSGYHKNLGISYPNASDIAASKKMNQSTGGDVKIHGLRNGLGFISKFQRCWDWTAGCIALTDEEVDELYESVAIGTKIEIKP